MVGVVAIRLTATSVGTILAALLVQALIGTTASMTLFLLVAGVVVVRLVMIGVDWWTTSYLLHDDALEYRVGSVSASTQRIAFASIHGIRQDAPWLLRILRCHEVFVEHGADGAQVRFAALTSDAAAEIVTAVRAANPAVTAPASPEGHDAPTVDGDRQRLPIGLYAVARGRYFLIIPLAFAALGIVAQLTGSDYLASGDLVWAWLRTLSGGWLVALGAGAVLVTAGLGIGARLVSMANFRRTQTASALETRQGMISTSERSIASSDVTVVELRQPLLYRLLGRVMLFVSGGSGQGDPPLDLAPSVASDRADTVADWAVPWTGSVSAVSTTSSSGWVVAVHATGLCAGLAASLLALTLGPWGALGAVLVWLVVVAAASRSWTRVSVGEHGVVEVERRWIARRRWRFRVAAVLHVELLGGAFARVAPVASVRLVVADRGARTFVIRGLTGPQAAALYERLRSEARTGTYSYLRNVAS